MPDVDYHGWTHRPKSQGGTDPIEMPTSTWATFYGAAASITHIDNDYYVPINAMHTNDTAGYELAGISGTEADWLQINTPGFYTAEFLITVSGGLMLSAHVPRVEPIFSLGGTPSSMPNNLANADFVGTRFTAVDQQLSGHDEHSSLWYRIAFHWDPSSPDDGDLSDQDPLQISANLTTLDWTDSLDLLLKGFVQRVSGPGYTETSLL